MPRLPTLGPPLSVDLIAELTDLPKKRLWEAVTRKEGRQLLDLNSLRSVILWLASHGNEDLRKEMLWRSAAVLAEGHAGEGGRPRT